MKPSPEEIPENSLDLLLFQYVEGELDAGQARQLERRLATDAALREELNLWQESFVQADFHDTSELEKTLLAGKTTHGLRFNLSNCVLLLLLAAMLFRPAPATKENPTRPVGSQAETPIAFELGNKLAPEISEAGPKKPVAANGRPSRQNKPLTLAEPELPETQGNNQMQFATIELPPLTPHLALETETLAIQSPNWTDKLARVKLKGFVAPKKQTGQQRRQIIRMKEKALQQRQANEFLKGNVPYVVPLKTDNF